MHIAPQEWRPPGQAPHAGLATTAALSQLAVPAGQPVQELYAALAAGQGDAALLDRSKKYIENGLDAVQHMPSELPDSPHDLLAWMAHTAVLASAKYQAYLQERKAGGERRYFANRAHALHFLRSVAPTKLVDGAWLYGVLEHWQDPRMAHLVTTYLEELGDGTASKNHVLLYRRLLAQHGLEPLDGLDDALYAQGTFQLALGQHATDFLPEIIGFNLGYEQLPLHLLITAYELNELGIDPTYFMLHITVDNAGTGHARRAVDAVFDNLPRLGDSNNFWQRVRQGCKLGDAGLSTVQAIDSFDIDAEVQAMFMRKAGTGHGAHSDYCRLAGRSINDWLARPEEMPDFLAALHTAGWVKRDAPAEECRFWRLLRGESAEMFGVFSPYELQLIHDWLRGKASADGQSYDSAAMQPGQRCRSFRAAGRQSANVANTGQPAPDLPDTDIELLITELASAASPMMKKQLLLPALAPAVHWTPAGLFATRQFAAMAACA